MRREVIERLRPPTFLQGAEDYEFVSEPLSKASCAKPHAPLYYYCEHGTQRSKEFYGVRSALTSQAVEGEGA